MRGKFVLKAIFACCLLLAAVAPSMAQEQPAPAPQSGLPLKVITRVIAPFVLKDEKTGQYSGFSVELWRAIAKQLGREFSFVEKNNVKEIMAGVEAGEGDVAIAAISITSEREQKFDFSQPMFDAGLQIMVRAEGEGGFSWSQLWGLLSTGAMPLLLTLLIGLITIPAFLIWLFERGHHNSLIEDSFVPGFFHAVWWSTGATAGQQPERPHSRYGRVMAWLAIFLSMFFMTYFQATVTTALTVQQLKGGINGPEDLVGHKVATTKGSTAASYLKAINVVPLEVDKIEDAEKALDEKAIDAVVFDAPVLLYYAATKGNGKVRMVGDIFKKQAYGILFPQKSELRKMVNEALLKLREDGTFDSLYDKYFTARGGGN